MSEKRIAVIDTCCLCPHLRDYGLFCGKANKRFEENWDGKTIPDWCPLDKYEEEKCISKTQK